MAHGENRYELLELVGAGGMAEIYRAKMVGAVGFEKPVAIKRLRPDINSNQDFVKRFIDEARLTARLSHPNICQILDFGTINDCYFITMEYVDGLDLSALLRDLDPNKDRMPIDVALYITCGILRGLQHAHDATHDDGRPLGIVHRDVSPQNVLLSVNGDVKLSDFGAAKAIAEIRSVETQKNFRIGKVLYMAPEQRRREAVDSRADIYSVGILLTEMILGVTDFHQSANMYLAGLCSLSDIVKERLNSPLGEEISKVIERSLVDEPSRRYHSTREMLSVLEELIVNYVPGLSVDRLARLVRRLKNEKKTKKSKKMVPSIQSQEENPSAISLHNGSVSQVSISFPPPPEGLEGPATLVDAQKLTDREDPTEEDLDSDPEEEIVTQIHRSGRSQAQDKQSDEISDDFSGETIREAPKELPKPPRSGRFYIISILGIAIVLALGLAFGGLLADRLFPPPSPETGAENSEESEP